MTSPNALVTVDELAARVGPIPDSDQARAAACLDDTTALVLREAGSKSSAWTADTVPADVRAVVLAAAGRVYRNPDGLTSQTIGPFTIQRSAASVAPYLTDYERGVIRKAAGLSSLASVRVHRDDCLARRCFVPVEGSNEPIEYYGEWDWL